MRRLSQPIWEQWGDSLMEKPLLEARDIHGGYSDVKVLNGVELVVHEGEIVAVIGPNGSGKSTLMKTIFGLLKPNSGRILFRGEEITGLEPFQIIRRGLCYVPQESNVFPSLTVEENLEMGAYILEDPEEIAERKEQVYQLFPYLQERSGLGVRKLSGGARQMVAFARGLMLQPSLLLFDEPSAGLAPQLVGDVLDKLREINEYGTSLLIVEQHVQKALELCHRGYVLDMGRTLTEDTGRELLNNNRIREVYMGEG